MEKTEREHKILVEELWTPDVSSFNFPSETTQPPAKYKVRRSLKKQEKEQLWITLVFWQHFCEEDHHHLIGKVINHPKSKKKELGVQAATEKEYGEANK